jgi:P-type conjugative transfer protein TrbJ
MFRRNFLAAASAMLLLGLGSTPADAQMTVVDPTNLVQNALTAARTLEQINNQIRSLQNEATNLVKLGKTFAPELTERLEQISALMQEANLVALRVQETRDRLDELYKGDWLDTNYLDLAKTAEDRLDASREALRNSLILQAQVVEQIQDDQATLKNLSQASQDAEGALGAQQATNELLAFQAAQNMRLQNLLAAQSRADALEQARQMEALAAARAERKRFFDVDLHPGARPWN